ncbi:hypothetical protein B0H21DRAFT_824120 [Amylocystis lapponica]|nr:hypothetical protein B0H21DRAFT_824120 [Amylocystis lapponica]
MPGLVQRYKISSEYAELVSTVPTQRSRTHRGRRWTSAATAAISDEASSWYTAACPPLEDLQAVLQRIRVDQDFSQERTFRFLSPLLVFGILFATAVIALQPYSFAHHILSAPKEHTREIVTWGMALVGSLLAGLVILRTVIWCVAEVSDMIIVMDRRRDERERNTKPLPPANVLLGAFFM